jgi:hypothetical protein
MSSCFRIQERAPERELLVLVGESCVNSIERIYSERHGKRRNTVVTGTGVVETERLQ